jgi:hypothetical protein
VKLEVLVQCSFLIIREETVPDDSGRRCREGHRKLTVLRNLISDIGHALVAEDQTEIALLA